MNIIGHEHIIEYFDEALRNNKMSHAYLFQGPEGVGKSAVVEWLVKKIIGDSPENSSIIDILRISLKEDKKEISIDEIRDLRRFLHKTSSRLKFKIAILEDVELLSSTASNAVLKILEEPPGNSLLLLTANKSYLVPDTVKSRCQQIFFHPVPTDVIEKAIKEYIGHKDSPLIARMSLNLPGVALRLAEDSDFLKARSDEARDFLESLSGTLLDRMEYIHTRFPKGESPVNNAKRAFSLLKIWKQVVRDLILMKVGVSDTIVYTDLIDSMKKNRADMLSLVDFQRSLMESEEALKKNAGPRLVLENLIIGI